MTLEDVLGLGGFFLWVVTFLLSLGIPVVTLYVLYEVVLYLKRH